MKTTVELLHEVKIKHHLPSDGRLAAMLGLSRSAVSRFMAGKDHPGDETAMKVAGLLDLDPAYVMACIHAEREKNEAVRRVWSRMAERMAIAAALVAVALIAPALPWEHSGALLLAAFTSGTRSLYIMSNAAAIAVALSFTFAYACPRYIRRPKN